MKLTINDIPPSNNKFAGRTNRHEYQNCKKSWAELIYWEAIRQLVPQKKIERAKVELRYFFPDKRRRDPDNYSGKFLLDGLVQAEIIADDSFENIELVISGRYDKQNPRTEIIIEEA